MANWNKKELQTPKEIEQISQNAQNLINNLDILLKLVKDGANVAKLFLLLANPAGAIIKLAANEIIKLANDFKEIGVFYLFINPNDETYGNQTSRELGLEIKLSSDGILGLGSGLYQFEPSVYTNLQTFRPVEVLVGAAYQKSLDIADLNPNYRDSSGRSYSSDPSKFTPPTPILASPARWKLGGYNPASWTGHAPVTTLPLADGTFPSEMKPSRVLQIMSEAFDDRGDVSTFEIDPGAKNDVRAAIGGNGKIYDAAGTAIDKSKLQPDGVVRERLFLTETTTGLGTSFEKTVTLEQRKEITNRIQSGKPNFAGSVNIQGIEVIAIVALVGVESYQKFVDAWETIAGPKSLFGDMPSLGDFYKDIKAIVDKATAEAGTPMTITNNSEWGAFEEGDFIVGVNSGAKCQIKKIVKTEKYQSTVLNETAVKLEDGTVQIYSNLVDTNEGGSIQRLEVEVKMFPAEPSFDPEETIFEGVEVSVGPPGRSYKEIIIKDAKGSALDSTIPYDQVNIDDVASYGKVLGIDPTAPDSIHPDWTSIKIKDVIPHYGDFFDEIIQFAEGLKGYAAGADEFIARIIKLIDDTIKEFEEIVNKIKAFLQIIADGLPDAGVYWLTVKTYGGNKAIQDALTGSDDPPPESLNFCAGFIMVSVSGMGGSSATGSLEKLFGDNGFGLKFQEVAMIPEVTELDIAVQTLQDDYAAATAAQAELATDVFDNLGLNPPVTFRDATQITFTDWNGVEPNVGDYVLGTKSGAFGQILEFAGISGILRLDHIKPGPTIAGTKVDEERIVRLFDVTSGDFLEFPYDGSVPTTSALAFDANPALAIPLVGEGRFTEEVLVNRSSHKPNGQGTTVYEVFQGNEGTFVGVDDVEELVSESEFILFASQPFNTFGQDRKVKQQVFKVVNGSVKEPVLKSGFNGKFGSFTDDDTIISFGEESAQTFLADIEGRNAEDDKATRLKQPPTPDRDNTHDMKITVAGSGSISITAEGGEVESIAAALNNTVNPNNLPESAQERTARERAGN